MYWMLLFSQVLWWRLAAVHGTDELSTSATHPLDGEQSKDSLITSSHTQHKPGKWHEVHESDPALYETHEELQCDEPRNPGVSSDKIKRVHKLCCFVDSQMADRPCLICKYSVLLKTLKYVVFKQRT